MKFSRKLLLCAVTVISAQTAHARLYNYEDLPLGSRGFGMGNTAMALVDDVGSIYYNPAILAWAQGDQISAGVSAYSRIDTRTGAYVSLFKSAADNVKRGGFLSVPAMVGGFFKKTRWTWGGAVMVPNSFVNSGSFKIDDDSDASYESFIEDIWIDAFGSYDLDDRNSLGVGIFYVSRQSSEKFSYVDKVAGSIAIEFIEKSWDVNGFSTIIGFSRKQNERLNWGLSLRSPVLIFGAVGRLSDVKSGATEAGVSDFKPTGVPVPARLSAGFAYTWSEGRTFAADLHLYAPLKTNLHPDKLSDFEVDLRAIPSLHFGYEHFFRKGLAARVGYFTNLSAAKNVPNGISAIHDKVNMFGATAALVFPKESGEVSLGGWAQGGQGRSRSINPTLSGDVPRSNYFYGGVIASSYRF
ncbi:MAG: outer membrane protein transport protein [Bdellovibrionota bacterium]